MARSKKGKTTVDFKGKKGGKRVRKSGEYLCSVSEIEEDRKDKKSDKYWKWTFEVVEGEYEGAKLFHNTSFADKSLWNLARTLEAIGLDVPDGEMDLNIKEIAEEANQCMVMVEMEPYEGVMKSKVVDIVEAEGDDKKSSDGEDEDLPDEDVVKKMSEDELEEVVEDYDLEVDLDKIKGIKKKRAAVIKAIDERDEDGDDDGDEDNDEDLYDEDDVKKMKNKELKAVVKKHDLDVELTGKVKKDRTAVIEALEEEDLLSDDD